MTAAIEQEAPAIVSSDFAARKLRLIEHILGIEEEAELLEFEAYFDFYEEEPSEEELAFVAERIADAKANPDSGTPIETFMQQMRSRLQP